MRLFYGIELKESEKQSIRNTVDQYSGLLQNCSLIDWTNYHLTVKFIGEVDEEDLAFHREILDQFTLKDTNSTIRLDRIGTFMKRKGNIIWIGNDEQDKSISRMKRELEKVLKQEAELMQQEFIPHVTIARKCRLSIDDSISPIEIKIDNITLFESLRVEGILRYRPIHKRQF